MKILFPFVKPSFFNSLVAYLGKRIATKTPRHYETTKFNIQFTLN